MDTNTHIHTCTYTQDNYSNPRCACAPRVNKEETKSVKSVCPRWQAGQTGWRRIQCGIPFPHQDGQSLEEVSYTFDREIPRRCPWGRPMLAMVWIASSLSHPRTPQQGEQIEPSLHGRPHHEQPSSALSLLAGHASVFWLLLPGSVVVGSR